MCKRSRARMIVKSVLLFSLLTLSPLRVSAQRLTISENTKDVGRTGYMQPITATFELRNKSLRRLTIESVKTDCGCTAVDYPKEVGIGEKFTIKMTYDARQLGHFQKMAAIKSNGSKRPVYLIMRGIVLPEILDYSGTYPLAFGDLLLDKNELEYDDVNKGDHPIAEIHILNNGMKAMTPNVMHLPPYLTALVTPEILPPGKAGKVEITLNSEKLRDFGLNQTSVYLAQQLGDKVSPDNMIGISAVLLPDLTDYDAFSKALAPQLQMSATEIDFTDFGGKKKKTEEIIFQNIGKTTLNITSLQMFTRGLRITLDKKTLEPGTMAKMKVTGYAEDLQKVRTKPRILMITNDPDHAKVVINIKVKSEK